MKYLLDTNVVSEARKLPERRDPQFHDWISSVSSDDAAISVITLGEVLAGVIRLESRDADQGARLRRWYTNNLLAKFKERTLPVSSAVVEIEAGLQASKPRPKADALIAATALHHHLVLVTRNVKDFDGTGVALLNPWTSQSG